MTTIWPPTFDLPVPDGTTWNDDTGREWEAAGTLSMPAVDTPRVTLAAALVAAIGTDTGVQVYASPPEVPVPPAIVIRPADPYQAPYHASGTVGSAWAFDIDIIMRRNRSDAALDALERAREVVCAALPSGWRWIEFGDIGETEISKKRYLKGTLGVAVAYTEGMT